jgi:SAM domain (Sterile alpha motif)/Adenylate and Guanylate cyclase catalytic domain
VWEMVDWLKRLGLQQYSRCFAENDIDVSILRDLDDSDLEKIGVASLGHRRKLLRAIADLTCLEGHTPTGGRTAVVPSSDGAAKDTAERRQVTVVFSDLVGSTALSTRMDPEDPREVISAYQTCVADTVRRFGGFVAKYMGDGVLVARVSVRRCYEVATGPRPDRSKNCGRLLGPRPERSLSCPVRR